MKRIETNLHHFSKKTKSTTFSLTFINDASAACNYIKRGTAATSERSEESLVLNYSQGLFSVCWRWHASNTVCISGRLCNCHCSGDLVDDSR
jgi:hypothetical protein